MPSHPDPTELTHTIGTALRRYLAASILRYEQIGPGLSATDGQFLSLLELHGPRTPGQLAHATGLSTGTVTGVIDRLERAGYAHRERDPHDRRKVIVTPDRDRIMRDFAPLFEPQARQIATLLAHYDPHQLATIADFLTRLADQPTTETT